MFQRVTVVQPSGQDSPLTVMEVTCTGAAPESTTALLGVMNKLVVTVKFAASSAASWLVMLVCAWAIQVLMAEGSCGLRPLARKAAYFASRSGPYWPACIGPLISSLSARQYMRRKVGLIMICAQLESPVGVTNRFWPGAQEIRLPSTMPRSNMNSVHRTWGLT